MNAYDFEYQLDRVPHFVDGDTFDVVVSKDIGFHVRTQFSIRVRVLYIDTYELHKGSVEDRIKGAEATAFTAAWLDDHIGFIHVRTVDQDSFGRWLSEVYAFYPISQTTLVLAEELVKAGFQKPDSQWGPK